MHAFVLQDWTTIRSGGSGTTVITQPERGWLDLERYQDVVFWTQVTEITGSPSLAAQTSPTRDDSLFMTMLGGAIGGVGVTVGQVLMLSASVPLARYLRWQLSGAAPWDVTLRIMVVANAPGM